MPADAEVERWYTHANPALEEPLRRVRQIILGADRRMTEYLKHGTVQFAYEGDMANFVQVKSKKVTLMFNVGARIPGRFPHLEGSGPNARFMRFDDVPMVEARASELARIVTAWCASRPQRDGEPKKRRSTRKS